MGGKKHLLKGVGTTVVLKMAKSHRALLIKFGMVKEMKCKHLNLTRIRMNGKKTLDSGGEGGGEAGVFHFQTLPIPTS